MGTSFQGMGNSAAWDGGEIDPPLTLMVGLIDDLGLMMCAMMLTDQDVGRTNADWARRGMIGHSLWWR